MRKLNLLSKVLIATSCAAALPAFASSPLEIVGKEMSVAGGYSASSYKTLTDAYGEQIAAGVYIQSGQLSGNGILYFQFGNVSSPLPVQSLVMEQDASLNWTGNFYTGMNVSGGGAAGPFLSVSDGSQAILQGNAGADFSAANFASELTGIKIFNREGDSFGNENTLLGITGNINLSISGTQEQGESAVLKAVAAENYGSKPISLYLGDTESTVKVSNSFSGSTGSLSLNGIYASGQDAAVTVKGLAASISTTAQLTAASSDRQFAVFAENGASLTFESNAVSLSAAGSGFSSFSAAIGQQTGSTVQITGGLEASSVLTTSLTAGSAASYGLYVLGSAEGTTSFTASGETISITAKASSDKIDVSAYGAYGDGQSSELTQIQIGGEGSNVSISAEVSGKAPDSSAYGLFAQGSTIALKGNEITVSATAAGTSSAYGVLLGTDGVLSNESAALNILASSAKGRSIGVSLAEGVQGAELTIGAGALSVSSSGDAVGVLAERGNAVTLNGDSSVSVAASSSFAEAVGLKVKDAGSSIRLDASSIEVTASATGTAEFAAAVLSPNTENITDEDSLTNIYLGMGGAKSILLKAENASSSSDTAYGILNENGKVWLGGGSTASSIEVSAAKSTGVQITGENSYFAVSGDSLSFDIKGETQATGLSVSDSAHLHVNAPVSMNVAASDKEESTGVGISIAPTKNGSSETTPSTNDAGFLQDVEVNVTAASAVGVAVLNSQPETDPDKDLGSLAQFQAALKVAVTGFKEAVGILADNNASSGSGTAGNFAGVLVDGKAAVSAEGAEKAAAVRLSNGSEMRVNGLEASAVSSEGTAYGLIAENNPEKTVAVYGAASITAEGKDGAYALKGEDSTITLGGSETDSVLLSAESKNDEAYAILLGEKAYLTLAGETTTKGKISAQESIVVTGSLQMENGLKDMEEGILQIEGTLKILSEDIFTVSAESGEREVGELTEAAKKFLIFGESSTLNFTDETYTLGWLMNAQETFNQESTPAGPLNYVMAGSLEGNILMEDLEKLSANAAFTKATLLLTTEDNGVLDTNRYGIKKEAEVTRIGVGNVETAVGADIKITGENTLAVTGTDKTFFTSPEEAVNVSVEDSARLELGGEGTEGGTLKGILSLSDSSTVSISAPDAEEAKEFAINGNVSVEDEAQLVIESGVKVLMEKLEAAKDALVSINTAAKQVASSLSSQSLRLYGTFFQSSSGETSASAFEEPAFEEGSRYLVGKNSVSVLGSSDTELGIQKLEEAQAKAGADADISSGLYLETPVNLNGGSIQVDSSLSSADKADVSSGEVSIGKDSFLGFKASEELLNGSVLFGSGSTLNLAEGSYLLVDLDDVKDAGEVSIVLADKVNDLGTIILPQDKLWYDLSIEGNTLTGLYDPTSKVAQYKLIGVNSFAAALSDSPVSGQLSELIHNRDFAGAARLYNQIALVGTASGAEILSLDASDLIRRSIEKHGSVLNTYSHEKRGGDLWVDLNGMLSKASSYQAGPASYGYKSHLAGITFGADYSTGKGAAFGVAFSAGTGKVKGQDEGAGIKNKSEYWGAGIYGTVANKYLNLIGAAAYLKSKNTISYGGRSAKPAVYALSASVRMEKPLALTDSLVVTPHLGLAYTHLKTENFRINGFRYSADDAHIVQIPVGVSFNGDFKTKSGIVVKPFIDFSVIPAVGDTKTTHGFQLVNAGLSDDFSVRIRNSLMYQGIFGLYMGKRNHSLGVNYLISAGDEGRLDQALQANYRYKF